MNKPMITQSRLKELMQYEPETGLFTWIKPTSNRVKAGSVAATNSHGRIAVRVDGRTYRVHRLAWLYVTGEWPSDEVDHINGVSSDNRWINLRLATRGFNMENIRAPHKDNKNGVLGVSPHQGRFLAKICVKGKQIYIGMFDTPELAHAAYLNAKRSLHAGCTI